LGIVACKQTSPPPKIILISFSVLPPTDSFIQNKQNITFNQLFINRFNHKSNIDSIVKFMF
jgi:hypothetical protein